MKNLVKKSFRSTKNFVSNHKTGVAVVATALICGAAARRQQSDLTSFIKDRGLYEEFVGANL